MIAACTIVSRNYLHFARVVCESFLAAHPGARFFVLLVDRLGPEETFAQEKFELIPVESIAIPQFASIAFKYDILELNTNVKPSFLKWILKNRNIERLIYLDPDIYVYSALAETYQLLDSADVVLTPHILSPVQDDRRPREQDFLLSGVFNLGFVGVANRKGSIEILDWWEARCLGSGFSEQRAGLFVDQKWANLFPCFFAKVAISRDPGCNMAYWNLHERRIERRDGEYWVNGASRLKFFHFSGMDLNDINRVSKYQNRFTLRERADLVPVFEEYLGRVSRNRNTGADLVPYAFGSFSDGTAVTELARRVYACALDKFAQGDPFDASGQFFAFAKRARLLSGAQAEHFPDSQAVEPVDVRLKILHVMLRLALYFLGADRYVLLMRYLGHISILRNQRPVFWRD